MMRPLLLLSLSLLFSSSLMAQPDDSEKRLKEQAAHFFAAYSPADGSVLPTTPQVSNISIDDLARKVTMTVDATFAMQEFYPKTIKTIYKKLRRSLPRPFNKYKLTLVCCGQPIEHLVDPTLYKINDMRPGQWRNISYDGKPWVTDLSKPNKVTHGLYNRHIALWASHGSYFDSRKQAWRWQRPNLFGTTEDLFTQTIVVPYLMPMLQNAGAVVFTPRERDWQRNEVIVDNDEKKNNYYVETPKKWRDAPFSGFAAHTGAYYDGENPFVAGTARMTLTTRKNSNPVTASYQPNIPEEGRYAVYVSYQTVEGSVDDAEYAVYHKGQKTTFHVNQQMGGSTWVYLGSFLFDKGCSQFNRVVLSNRSAKKGGIVTTDAVRFGGGMGNISRGGQTSHLPRCLEGARYNAQWSGVPYDIYSTKKGADDYGDDLNSRSLMTNWLAGGSPFVPLKEGKRVPIELSLALHSDAGYDPIGHDIVGSLAVCTTGFNDGMFGSGASRLMSRDFADSLLTNTCRDIKAKYKRWNRRYLWDRNYSETRCPEVPSAILEMLSHQNFPDMVMGQDPNFKFDLARSVYKTILRYVSAQHGQPCIVQPLQPANFCIKPEANGLLSLVWTPTVDPQEPSAMPTSYNIYMAEGTGGFDNGTMVVANHYTFKPQPGVKYSFKVTAVNRGGESFPTETLCAVIRPEATKTVLVVNGFNRLSAPAVIDDGVRQGFDLATDIGVQRDIYAGWNGQQTCFDKSRMGREGPGALGYGGDEMAGHFVCGNTFSYVSAHTDALASSHYNIVSCSSKAVEAGMVSLDQYSCVDLILGLEKNDAHALVAYKTFTANMQQKLKAYTKNGGSLVVSGAYIGHDMSTEKERAWLADVLKVSQTGINTQTDGEWLNGLSTDFAVYRTPNATHYAAQQTDVLSPQDNAYCAMQYADGSSAAVAYDGPDYKAFTAGFPLECIQSADKFKKIMSGIIAFVMK